MYPSQLKGLQGMRFAEMIGLCLIAGLPATGHSQIQTTAQTPTPSALPPKGKLVGPYVDGSFGFSIPFPAGSSLEREKRLIAKADLEVIRFVQLSNTWSLVVRLTKTTRPLSPEMMSQGITEQLKAKHEAFKVILSEPAKIAGRDGFRYAATFVADDKNWLRQQAVIHKQTTEYFNIILITPLEDRGVATRAFDEIVADFKILRSELTQEQLEDALRRGTALRRHFEDDPRKISSLTERSTYLRFVRDNREIGFVHVQQILRKVDHREGIVIHERGWLFEENDTVTQLEHDMFVSADLSYAKWDHRIRFLQPVAGSAKHVVSYGMESAIRSGDKLLITYTPHFNAHQLKEKALEVEPSFGSAAFFALLPQLVDLKKPELYAFSAYNTDRRGLMMRCIQVEGPVQVQLDGRARSAWRLKDSEGLLPPITEIDVDAEGRVLRIGTAALEMLTSTQKQIEREYKTRIEYALKTFEKYPITPPSPAERENP